MAVIVHSVVFVLIMERAIACSVRTKTTDSLQSGLKLQAPFSQDKTTGFLQSGLKLQAPFSQV